MLVDLEAGVYHFSPAEFALRRLRAGDYRSVLSEATRAKHQLSMRRSPSFVPARTGAMRGNISPNLSPLWLDNGTLLANMLAVATALGMPAKVICGFQDADVNRLA